MAIADVRTGIAAELTTDTGVEFVGRAPTFEGGIARRDLGFVWIEGYGEMEDNADLEAIAVRVRVYQQFVEPRSEEDGVDPARLEQLAESIESALKDKQSTQFGVWYYRVANTDFDWDAQFVEVSATAVRASAFSAVT